jgi:hypothetical protein
MAFIATPYCLLLRQDQVGNKNTVIYPCMALNTSDTTEMGSLVGQPFMFLQNIYLLPGGQKLKPGEVRMAIQTDRIVIKDGFFQIFTVPDVDLIAVGIMAFPACKSFFLQLEVGTLPVICFYFLKTEAGESFVSSMAIEAVVFKLHAKLSRVREIDIFR